MYAAAAENEVKIFGVENRKHVRIYRIWFYYYTGYVNDF